MVCICDMLGYVQSMDLCMQDGIKPMWEDERNRRGGRWLITLSKQQRKSDLDQFWLETVSSGFFFFYFILFFL